MALSVVLQANEGLFVGQEVYFQVVHRTRVAIHADPGIQVLRERHADHHTESLFETESTYHTALEEIRDSVASALEAALDPLLLKIWKTAADALLADPHKAGFRSIPIGPGVARVPTVLAGNRQ